MSNRPLNAECLNGAVRYSTSSQMTLSHAARPNSVVRIGRPTSSHRREELRSTFNPSVPIFRQDGTIVVYGCGGFRRLRPLLPAFPFTMTPTAPVLGNKHPWGWTEIWRVLKPLIDTQFTAVLQRGTKTSFASFDRYGFNEETHWLIAYSLVRMRACRAPSAAPWRPFTKLQRKC